MSAELSLPQLQAGEVWIVGAGSGELGLLTLHGLNALQQADVVLHDSLVAPAVLALAKGECLYVGKKAGAQHSSAARKQKDVSAQMIALAQDGKKVVRLKGGDAGIFGRGGEEAEALLGAGIEFKVFAGVSAALSAAHRAEVSLTHRDKNQALAFVTGHDVRQINWRALAEGAGVIAVYMPQDYSGLKDSLLAAGKAQTESVAIISHAGLLSKEKIIHTTLQDLDQHLAAPPAIVIIGAKKWRK